MKTRIGDLVSHQPRTEPEQGVTLARYRLKRNNGAWQFLCEEHAQEVSDGCSDHDDLSVQVLGREDIAICQMCPVHGGL